MSRNIIGDMKNNNAAETEKILLDSNLINESKKEFELNDEALFDSLMEKIGNDGKFQNRFDFLYNFVLVTFATMPYLNIVLAMTIPDHWCHVPGREYTNYTKEEWKEINIPR